MPSLVSPTQAAIYNSALQDQFDTFKGAIGIYVNAQTVTLSTSPTFSRFGQHDQNAMVGPDNTAVTPTLTTIYGTVYYGNGQKWEYIEPGSRGNYQQDKIRESFGTVRIKVASDGYDMMKQCKLAILDGFQFTLISNAKPHGLLFPQTRWDFTLQKLD